LINNYQYQIGDIAFSHINSLEHVGKTALYDGNPEVFLHGMNLLRLRIGRPDISPKFAYYFMQTNFFRDEVRSRVGKAVNQVSINQKNLATVPFLIAPLADQQSIVACVEALLSHVKAARDRLSRVPSIMKRFRQGILSAACTGRLTEGWREENPDVEPAIQLISNEIPQKKKKRAGRLWGAGLIPELTDEERDIIPDNWTWTKVKNLGENSDETVQVGPMSMITKDFSEKGVPLLTVGSVQWGTIDESKLNYYPEDKAKEFNRYKVKKDDILFTRAGTVGRCAMATDKQDGYLITFNLLRVRSKQTKCLPKYLYFVFEGAPHIKRQTLEGKIGSTRTCFNTNLLANLDVSLPPLAEQHEIIRRVESLFERADAIEWEVVVASRRCERLTQAVLGKAFRGELVEKMESRHEIK
jgi:type I restriction enzyme S subunit